MTQAIIYSNSREAKQSRARHLSDEAMDYWSVIRGTIHAMRNGRTMQTACQSAAQLRPANGGPYRALLARYM